MTDKVATETRGTALRAGSRGGATRAIGDAALRINMNFTDRAMVRWAVSAVLAAVLVAAQAWRDWRQVKAASMPSTVSAPQAGRTISNVAVRVEELVALDLMGAASTPPAVATRDLSETRLDLGLRGVFASARASLAGAVIVADGGKSGFYRIGDSVAPGVVLHAVAADSVVIQRSGVRETLTLPWSKPGGGTGSAGSASVVEGRGKVRVSQVGATEGQPPRNPDIPVGEDD